MDSAKYKAVVNGKRALNGKRYSVTFTGSASLGGDSLYEALRQLAGDVEANNEEMLLPDSLQVTIVSERRRK